MPIVRPEASEPNKVVIEESSFNYLGWDIILRSYDSRDFPLPKLYILICSPVLENIIRSVSNTSDIPNGDGPRPLPIFKLPESGVTFYRLLTFIFPVDPILPSTSEKIMELLGVAQKYQMKAVLSHIRGIISQKDPPFIRPETALHIYFLAQEHELRREAAQAARVTLRLPMAIQDLGDQFQFFGLTGAYLYELWKYHQRVRSHPSDLVFLGSGILVYLPTSNVCVAGSLTVAISSLTSLLRDGSVRLSSPLRILLASSTPSHSRMIGHTTLRRPQRSLLKHVPV